MARPGSRHGVAAPAAPPAPLDRATAAVLLTLVDAECRLWVAPGLAAALPWLLFHCGATSVEAIGQADFVLADTLPDLAALATGSDEGPEEAATVEDALAPSAVRPPAIIAGSVMKEPPPASTFMKPATKPAAARRTRSWRLGVATRDP